ncbi:MAG: DUF2066 domain-containing protein [Pseudolabrys sp.]
MRKVVIFATALALVASAAGAQTADTLYRSTFVVTGQGEANREVGVTRCFGDVLVKLTGDQTILADRRYRAFAATAPSLVQSFSYRDLLAGRPIHDEQGSYDRPHALTVAFDHGGIDAAVAALGRKPWLAARPRVVVFLAVENVKAAFVLADDSDTDRSADMRAAFAAASDKAAMPVAFPAAGELASGGFTPATLPKMKPAGVAALAQRHGDLALIGRMVFREKLFGWVAQWRMDYGGKSYAWSVRGVNFDAAFRNALFGAAQIASGNGVPK